ncbi:hypothetical protein BDV28DRAFT_149114 [Aspergillus coremiiformis]|uniref:DUF676 domain-containing protein n=1 Tax=Aspergillus coremiiformis TaxID=138285 RepID=A0A5N6Z5Z7_9EURO|nr:hypothetical protein BDV28DRAFT_149114 [Aspergillus coremiiformis]
MKNTLLLVFIHGFKGDDDTFGNFPEHVRALIGRALPAVNIAIVVYPKYETRGNLKECVGQFREWLQNQVIDLEVVNRTASPTVDPSVHVFLVGHSMGGIVAAETLLLLASEQPIPAKPSAADPKTAANSQILDSGSFMFPHIQGVLAFDTPFLGIAPGVVSYGAEGQYKNVTAAYSAFTEVAGLFGFGDNSSSSSNSARPNQETTNNKTLPPQHTSATTPSSDAAATPSWQRWGRYAMFAGAAGAVAAGGAAAMYSQRQRLTDGWGWVSSHLAFVGCLARPADLRQRISLLSDVHKERGIGCTNFFTALGKNATSLVETPSQGKTSLSQRIIRARYRTFCTLPPEVENEDPTYDPKSGLGWVKAVNDKAADEIKAHVSMFLPKENPAFDKLVNEACKVVARSIDKGWYSTATGPVEQVDGNLPRTETARTPTDNDGRFMDGDDVVIVE